MNQQQVKYARERLGEIHKRRAHEIRQRHTKDGVTLSERERVAALRNGDFKVKPGVQRAHCYTDVVDVIEFTGEKKGGRDDAAIEKETAALKKQFDKAMDELMLGDSEKALKLIQNFDK